MFTQLITYLCSALPLDHQRLAVTQKSFGWKVHRSAVLLCTTVSLTFRSRHQVDITEPLMNNATYAAFSANSPLIPQMQGMQRLVGAPPPSFDYGSFSSNTMPPPTLPNSNSDVLSYIQRIMEPVGSLKDEVILITALREAEQNGLNRNLVFSGLHGVSLYVSITFSSMYVIDGSEPAQ